MYKHLENINSRPLPFGYYTASELWTNEHTSLQMLSYHLNGDIDVSSRKSDFIDRSVAWIVEHFGVRPGFKIADFGCGPGLYAHRLAERGASVTGIDFSPRSIAYAREAATNAVLDINYINQNYLEFKTDDRFDLIIMIMCDYCALSPQQRKHLLGIFRSVLNPGGKILLDVYSLHAFAKRQETAIYEENLLHGFWSPQKYYGFLNTFKYETEKVVLDKYTIIGPERTRTIYNWLQYFSPDDLQKELTDNRFSVDQFYADVAGSVSIPDSDEFAITAVLI